MFFDCEVLVGFGLWWVEVDWYLDCGGYWLVGMGGGFELLGLDCFFCLFVELGVVVVGD